MASMPFSLIRIIASGQYLFRPLRLRCIFTRLTVKYATELHDIIWICKQAIYSVKQCQVGFLCRPFIHKTYNSMNHLSKDTEFLVLFSQLANNDSSMNWTRWCIWKKKNFAFGSRRKETQNWPLPVCEKGAIFCVYLTMTPNPEQNKQINNFIKFFSPFIVWIFWFPCKLQSIHHAPISIQFVNKDITVDFQFDSRLAAKQTITVRRTIANGTTPPKRFWFSWSHSVYFVIVVDHRSNNGHK